MAIELLFIDSLNPEAIIRYGGLTLLLLIVFAETGLFFGFFLPGDSLLFTAGLLSTTRFIQLPVGELILLVVIAAVSGSTAGYFTGKLAHRYLKTRKENFFYKKEYLDITSAFYRKYGGMAFIIGRFLPMVRTFVTIMAGMAGIDFKKFFLFNVLGVVIWATPMILLGHWLGNVFPDIIDYIDYIVIGLAIVTAIPVYFSWRKYSRERRKKNQGA